jgi:uncharacterized Zn finger protein
MPGLIRGVARTAVIAGTATTVSNRVSRRQANKWAAQDQQQQQQQYEQQQYQQQQYAQQQAYQQPAAPEPAGASMDEAIAQIKQLGELKDQGLLTEEEFAAQKARLLGS